MQVLEFMECLEFVTLQSVRQNEVGLATKEVTTLDIGDLRDGSENVCTVRGAAFDPYALIDASVAGLLVEIEIAKLQIKVDLSSTQVTTEQRSMSGKHRRRTNGPFAKKNNTDRGIPMECTKNSIQTSKKERKKERKNSTTFPFNHNLQWSTHHSWKWARY
jgi:hypothetical protein